MSDKLDCIVIGAGAVGLAVARALAESGRDVMVLERHSRIGEELSSHNSEVIHAGIYYPANSLKARLCVAGNKLLYAYSRERGVEAHACGKLIVATTTEQEQALARLQAQAEQNGVHDLKRLDAEDVRALEPALAACAALLSPSTGIVDSHALLLNLQADIERAGGQVVLQTQCTSARRTPAGWQVDTYNAQNDAAFSVTARTLVNAAGLEAVAFLGRIEGFPTDQVPPTYFAKGHYFKYSGRSPFQHLIYPVPQPGGLGIHVTLDRAGHMRFGPDVEWVQRPDWQVDAGRKPGFVEAIRHYWPHLDANKLQPDYAGVRPKLVGPGQSAADFLIQGPRDHGMPELVNLLGIESPGLTASLAIGRHVAELLKAH